MIDEETRREVDRIAREAAEAAQRGGSGAEVLAAIDELQARLADVGHSYGMHGGDAVPGNFEPVFADDNGTMKLSSVGGGYWPFGRVFTYAVPDVDDSAKFATGLIYLEVAHPSTGSSSSSARATVKGGQSLPVPTDSMSYIPLYQIENGSMAVDYRSCMSLPMREL